ncbi:MAG TPA: DUF6059 family protein [Micromonosporaceae bacterium]|nr:DUF6059 family protein [Micromonosporaceae bacterium]
MAKRRWARLAWALARECAAGLAHFGYLLVAVSPHLLDGPPPARAARPRQVPSPADPPGTAADHPAPAGGYAGLAGDRPGPPEGHPERLATHPLSPVERELWAQLD